MAAWPALVPAAALPVLFVHVRYQPKVQVGLASTTVGIELSDLAVLAVVLAAAFTGLRDGWEPLGHARRLWLAVGVFLALVLAATLHPPLWQDHYAFATHVVSASKFCEYALLAPALALLLRRGDDARPLLWSLVAVSAVATGWAVLQFAGLVNEFEGKRPLQREPSFVGIHDFAALSGAALVVALAVLVLGGGGERALAALAGSAGAIGLVLSGAVTGVVGVGLAALVVLAVARARGRLEPLRVAAVLALVIVVSVGVPLLRGGEVRRAVHELGIGTQRHEGRRADSYVQRSLLGYIGLRIFLDHPVLGVGWQASEDLENYSPYLADAHRRFPDVADVAFPSPAHPWGIQNAYVETLADLGVVGFVALLALFGVALVLGWRAAVRAPPALVLPGVAGMLWLVVAGGVWNGVGLVAGIPLDALTWLGVGLIGAAAAWTDDARGG